MYLIFRVHSMTHKLSGLHDSLCSLTYYARQKTHTKSAFPLKITAHYSPWIPSIGPTLHISISHYKILPNCSIFILCYYATIIMIYSKILFVFAFLLLINFIHFKFYLIVSGAKLQSLRWLELTCCPPIKFFIGWLIRFDNWKLVFWLCVCRLSIDIYIMFYHYNI